MMSVKITERSILSVASLVLALAASTAFGQESESQARYIPGSRTAANIMASSADGLSRYLAPDGPIQPALTAIGGLPMRGMEFANRGISRISQGFDSGAQRLSRAGGNDEGADIRMPGMQTLESSMPTSVANLGGMLQGAIQKKNKFIMGQAERGVEAGERLRGLMQNKVQSLGAQSSGPAGMMSQASDMMGGAQDFMLKGGQQLRQQVKQSLDGHMDRLQGVQQIGENVRGQAEGVGNTLRDGLAGTIEQLQRTADRVRAQIKQGAQQNGSAAQGLMGSMQGSMSNMGQNMQKNAEGVARQAANAVQQLTSSLQKVASSPLNMVRSLGQNLGQLTQGASGGSSSGGNRNRNY